MRALLRKLSSRKFWAAAAGVVMGVAMIFGVDENTVRLISGAVLSVVSLSAYIVTEGRVDAAGVAAAMQAVQTAADAVAGSESEAES